jgi:hypothetical protein
MIFKSQTTNLNNENNTNTKEMKIISTPIDIIINSAEEHDTASYNQVFQKIIKFPLFSTLKVFLKKLDCNLL